MLPRCVIVERPTEFRELLARHATRGQVRFFLEQRGIAIEQVAAAMVEAEGADERHALAAARKASTIDAVQGAQLRIDEQRARIDAETGADILLALALRELAGQLGQIEHLTITPDMLTPVLARLNR